jgi:hypothetical protein
LGSVRANASDTPLVELGLGIVRHGLFDLLVGSNIPPAAFDVARYKQEHSTTVRERKSVPLRKVELLRGCVSSDLDHLTERDSIIAGDDSARSCGSAGVRDARAEESLSDIKIQEIDVQPGPNFKRPAARFVSRQLMRDVVSPDRKHGGNDPATRGDRAN